MPGSIIPVTAIHNSPADDDDRRPVDRSRVIITRELMDKRLPPDRGILFEGIVRGEHRELSPLLDPAGNYVLSYQLDDGTLVPPTKVTAIAPRRAAAPPLTDPATKPPAK